MVEEKELNAIGFSVSSVLGFWTDRADYNGDFTDNDLRNWMDAVVPIIVKLKGRSARIRDIKKIAKKTGQKGMSKEVMLEFLDVFNDELAKQGMLKSA